MIEGKEVGEKPTARHIYNRMILLYYIYNIVSL